MLLRRRRKRRAALNASEASRTTAEIEYQDQDLSQRKIFVNGNGGMRQKLKGKRELDPRGVFIVPGPLAELDTGHRP
jgi:hypothetical protein